MGREVTAIVRDRQKAVPLETIGVRVLLADLDQPQDVGDQPLVFWFAPPPGSGEADTRLRGWLAAQRGRIERFVYISTSAVYGDCEGRWIDEDAPLQPQSPRGRRRADAEAALHEWQARSGATPIILRVPGIYGPGRLPIERLQRGLPMLRASECPYTNRIHADDLAEAALHAAVYGRAGRAYNIADGEPTTMADYFARCAQLLNLPAPQALDRAAAQAALTPAMWSFMEESKRLQVHRMREELHFSPRYANLERGLPSCL